ncbi:MAG TPA: SPOR domain-containing protein [Sphingomonadaceae bacterium]|nr:SPOR domain-containing protein [Sphingomonadaceae bacterium]
MNLVAIRRRLWLGAALAGLAVPASAQVPPSSFPSSGFGSAGIYSEDPATALARYLRVITANPRNLDALTGAGRAALQVGDAQAAIGFFARAEQISPKNGRVKAGLGSALVLLHQEQAALRYFDDATQLGVPEADIASDRGLAYDLRGSTKRAQRDYAIALKRGADDETTRRMALSMAISGERDAALAMLDPLVRRQDTAAWRARAFILAMTGDTAGASRAAASVMNASMAADFAPFFRKLPSLRPGEKAAAVHFGLFPGESRPIRIDDLFNQAEVAARVALENSPQATDAGSVDRSQGALGRVTARADGEGQLAANIAPRVDGQRLAAVATPRPNAPGVAARNSVTRGAPTQPARTGLPSASVTTPSGSTPGITAAPTPAPAPTFAPTPAPAPSPTTVARVIPGPASATTPASAVPLASAPGAGAQIAISGGPATPTPTSVAVPAPGFGGTATVTPSATSTVTTPGATPVGRLADISATVREIVRDPAVRAAEIPASSVPPAVSNPIAATQGPPARPQGDTAAAVTANSTANVAPSSGGPAAVPPPSRPKVEAPTVATASTVAQTQPPLVSRPKVETPVVTGASQPKVETPVKVALSRPKVETRAAKPTADAKSDESARIWVQIAGGADEKAFPAEFRRLKAKAPELLTAQAAWSTPLKATNRLLVGPFESQRAAQDFVNKLAPKGITAFAWTSADGQAIAKVAAK